jgi:hypothetical protein
MEARAAGTASALTEIEVMPRRTSASANSGWFEGAWPHSDEVLPAERVEDHELGAQQPDAVDRQGRDLLGALGHREVDVQAGGQRLVVRRRRGRGGDLDARRLRGHVAGEHLPAAAVDRDDLAVAQRRGRRAGADDAGDPQLAADDRGVAGHAARVGDDAGGAAHGRHPVGRRHRRDEHLAGPRPCDPRQELWHDGFDDALGERQVAEALECVDALPYGDADGRVACVADGRRLLADAWADRQAERGVRVVYRRPDALSVAVALGDEALG